MWQWILDRICRLKPIGYTLLMVVGIPTAAYWAVLYISDWNDFNLYLFLKSRNAPTYWLANSANDYWARKLHAWLLAVPLGAIMLKKALKDLVDILD